MATTSSTTIQVVGLGDLCASSDPFAELVTYSLGSCVGVTVYDPVAKVGGMLHAMLPWSAISPEHAAARSRMYVDTGLVELVRVVMAMGGLKYRLQIKLAGGGQFLDAKKIFLIGERNVAAVLLMLARNDVCLTAQHTGGQLSRTMRLRLSDGQVTISTPDQPTTIL